MGESKRAAFLFILKNLISISVLLVLLLSVKKYSIVFVEWPTCFLLGSTAVSVVYVSLGSN